MHVDDFNIANPHESLKTIDIYTCNKTNKATLFNSLAKATNLSVFHLMPTYGMEPHKNKKGQLVPTSTEKVKGILRSSWEPIERKWQITRPDGSTVKNLDTPKYAQ